VERTQTITIIIDTREQQPYTFDCITSPAVPFATVRETLDTGDYSLKGDLFATPDQLAIVERKSLADLYSSVAQGRIRLEAEFRRMKAYGYAALVIEADYAAILHPAEHLRHAPGTNPKSLMATLVAWSQRYGVHIWACPNRNFAERLTHRILERWARDRLLPTQGASHAQAETQPNRGGHRKPSRGARGQNPGRGIAGSYSGKRTQRA